MRRQLPQVAAVESSGGGRWEGEQCDRGRGHLCDWGSKGVGLACLAACSDFVADRASWERREGEGDVYGRDLLASPVQTSLCTRGRHVMHSLPLARALGMDGDC